jgi:hypothetical protein
VKTLPKNLMARLSRAGSQQQGAVSEALLSPVPCARCKRWRCKRKQQIEGEERGLLNRSTLSVNWRLQGEEEGALYRRAAGARGMNLDVTVNALQVVTVAVKALSYCRGLRATGNCHD